MLVNLSRPSLAITLAALGAALSPAAAAAAPCTPPGDLRSANIARADRPDGTSEVTEFLAGGEYRVTRCGRDGRLLVSQTVAPIRDPDGSTVLVPISRREPGKTIAMLYGDPAEATWSAAFRADRAALRASVIAPTAPLPVAPVALDPPPAGAPAPGSAQEPAPASPGAPARPAPSERDPRRPARSPAGAIARAAVEGDACTNPQFKFFELSWTSRHYDHRINRSRFQYNDTTVANIVDGHRNWDRTFNSCGLNDITDLTSHHLGSTSATVHSGPDGLSITDKGSMANFCPGALACAWQFSDDSGATAVESDIRFNESITFSNVGADNAYDVESVATHEAGHRIGLDHAGSSDALTMFPRILDGTTHVRSLAKGDVLGLRARYP